MRPVTLLTDFGTADGYVAVMKGVVLARAPDVQLIDVAHDLPQGDVAAAARALARYWAHFPPGTVHLVVVDPGVGTDRRGLALEVEGRSIVAPDNGVVTDVLERASGPWRAVELVHVNPPTPTPSRTFHGRDLFAPAAAHLAAGGALDVLGPEIARPVRWIRERPSIALPGEARGRVVSVDHFGNLASDLPGRCLEGDVDVRVAGRRARAVGTYADGREGEPVALVNSDGVVEIAVRNDSAARILEVGPGAAVEIRGVGGV